MSTSSKVVENLLEPAIVGVIAGVMTKVFYPDTGISKILNTFELPGPLLIGLTVGVSSVVGESLKLWVLPYIKNNSPYANAEAMLVGPALTGLTSVLAIKLGTNATPKYLQSFILGAGSSIAGKYAYDFVKLKL